MEASLPGTPDENDGQVVAHVDVDCFYAACERLREPALEGEPVVVGMGFEPGDDGGAVATASYEAREYGVESAMAITTALEKLPRKIDAARDDDLDVEDAGYYRPVDMAYYESVSEDVKAILRERADVLREVSVDEAYLDVTDRVDWNEADTWARELKRTVAEAVGVTASVGVAPTMSAAKVASDRNKPDGLVVVEPGDVRSFFADLPVEEVHGVGPVTAAELEEMGIETAGDLAKADADALEERFGDRGLAVYRYARGEDDRSVTPRGRPKSLSRESAFGEPTADEAAKRERVETLASAVAERARGKDALYQTIGIKVVTPPFDVNTRARSLPGPVDDPDLVESVALDLLEEFAEERVRKLGVRVSSLSFSGRDQSDLGSWDGANASDGNPPDDGHAESAATDAVDDDGPAPASPDDRQATSPADGQRATIPADDRQATISADDQQASSSADDQQASSPEDDQQASSPADDQQASSPADDRQATSPTDGQRASSSSDSQQATVSTEEPTVPRDSGGDDGSGSGHDVVLERPSPGQTTLAEFGE